MHVCIFIRHKYIVHRITVIFKYSNNIIVAFINSQPTRAYMVSEVRDIWVKDNEFVVRLHDLNKQTIMPFLKHITN